MDTGWPRGWRTSALCWPGPGSDLAGLYVTELRGPASTAPYANQSHVLVAHLPSPALYANRRRALGRTCGLRAPPLC